MRGEQTDAPSRRAVAYGPEPWRTTPGTEWSHWDLWFCVADHGGSWTALDAAISKANRHDGEAK